jgi:hypothetical protein
MPHKAAFFSSASQAKEAKRRNPLARFDESELEMA